MDLDELKRLKQLRNLRYKNKKKGYYLKKKLQEQNLQQDELSEIIDYKEELSSAKFDTKIKEIAHKQKIYVDDKKERIRQKIEEYYEKKREYYRQNREKRLKYDKEYRKRKKKQLLSN